jgi:hypothetical protein
MTCQAYDSAARFSIYRAQITNLVDLSGVRQVVGLARAPSRLPGGRITSHHTTIDGIAYKLADCFAERQAAFRLIYDAYHERGLMETNVHHMRITPHHLLNDTDVLVAKDGDQVIYTVTLVEDGTLRLPMEQTYPDEVAQRRDAGRCLAESSCLASRQGHFSCPRMFHVCSQILGLMFRVARARGVERLLAAFHPRHRPVYTRLFGFEQIGGLKTYAAVRDQPAVACEHNFAKLDQQRYRLYNQIYQAQFAPWELRRSPMSPSERCYFASVLSPQPDTDSAAS